MHPVLPLNKGTYLAPEYELFEAEGIIIGVTEFKTKIETGVWHSHENALISFAIKGGDLERRKGIEIERHPGLVTFYHSDEPHQNVYKLFPSKRMNIEISPVFFTKYNINEDSFHFAIKKNSASKLNMFKIYKELSNDRFEHSIHLLLLEIITSGEKIKNKNAQQWITTIREILHDRWNENISLKELSETAGVHPITISKHFSSYFGCTLGDYVRQLRLSKSMHLMNSASLSLTEIAFNCEIGRAHV